MVCELKETCIDDVLRAPSFPTLTATDEAGPSNTLASSCALGEDPLSLSGERGCNLTNKGISDNENDM